ncbi:hypothetical protein [Afipia carboxidovorans]|uniref:hypothetical protein n=1 Tax=Afipia carboxidovorans TaxID=40137 RepID=UPI00308AA90A|nr:hypothetical protein CRBSH125_01150 [Afipia carboxidovorans]
MAIKTVLADLSEALESLRDEYKEQKVGDKTVYVLDLEGIDDHPKVRGVITANRTNVAKRDEYKAKVFELEAKLAELPEDFDAEKWVELNANANKDDPAKRDEQLQSMKQVYEGKLQNAQNKYNTDIAAKDAEIAERDGYIDRSLVDAGLKDSLLDVGVNPDLIDGAMASLRGSVKVQRAENGDRKAIVETDLGEVAVSEFVKDWAQTKGKAYLAKPEGPDPKGNNGSSRGSKLPAGDFGGDRDNRVKAIASKFPELAQH